MDLGELKNLTRGKSAARMISRGLEPLDPLARDKLLDVVVAVVFAAPVIFVLYVILAGGEQSAASPARAGLRPLPLTDTSSVTGQTAVPSPGTTTVQRIRVPGPDRTVLTYQTAVAPGVTRVVRETIKQTEPGVTSRSTETLPGRIVTATVTAAAATVAVPGPTTTVVVTETAPRETVTVPQPAETVTVTEPAAN